MKKSSYQQNLPEAQARLPGAVGIVPAGDPDVLLQVRQPDVQHVDGGERAGCRGTGS